MDAESTSAIPKSPEPHIIPTAIDQNRNTRSMGSFIAVRNLTIESAPTIPRDTTTLDWIVSMIADVIIAIDAREILKLFE